MNDPAALSLAGFTAIAQRFNAPLYSFVRGFVRDPDLARDLTQDTFCDAWRAALRGAAPFVAGGDEAHVRNWLFQVAYRRAVESLRRRKLITWESLESALTPEPDDAAAPFEDGVIESQMLRAALDALSPQDAACLLLTVAHGFNASEAAEILDSTAQAVRKRVSRAKQRLLAAYLAADPSAPHPAVRPPVAQEKTR